MQLFRAIAYRLQRANMPLAEQQPEVTVFFEATDQHAANHQLPNLLALAWGCRPADVEFYNLQDEAQLLRDGGLSVGGLVGADAPPANPGPSGHPGRLGDWALLVTGWYHGPLFCRADRTLMLVRPLTLARLQQARRYAVPWHANQRAAAAQATGMARSEATARATLIRERAESFGHTDMGGFM